MSSIATPPLPMFPFAETSWSPTFEVRTISEGLRNVPQWFAEERSFVIVQDSPLASTRKRIEEFKSLSLNWDSYGSRPVRPGALSKACMLLRLLENTDEDESRELAPFAVAPMPGGGVQIDWHRGQRALELEIHPNGEFGYLIDDPESLSRFAEDDALSIDEAFDTVRRFLNAA